MRRYRHRKENRFLCILIIICLVLISASQLIAANSANADEPAYITTVVVEKGDSLWKIADYYDNNKIDLRKYIEIIQELNNLESTVLQPGDRVHIPIYID